MQSETPDAGPTPQPVEAMPDFRRLAVRIFFFNMLILTAAYTLYWYWVANAVEVEVLSWIQHQRARGHALTFDKLDRGGWPLAVTLTFKGARYAPAQDAPAWSWYGDGITLRHPIREPEKLGITLAGSQELTFGSGSGAATYAGSFQEATGEMVAGGWLPNGAATIKEMALMNAAGNRGLAVGGLSLRAEGDAAAPASPRDAGYIVTLEARQFHLPFTGLPFGAVLPNLDVQAEIMGALAPAPWPDAVKVWARDGGTLELTKINVGYGPVAANGTGTLALDRAGQPMGAFSFNVEGLPDLLNKLEADGVIEGAAAQAVRTLIILKTKTGPNGKPTVRMPLSLQDQVISIGPVALGRLPIIRWSGAAVP